MQPHEIQNALKAAQAAERGHVFKVADCASDHLLRRELYALSTPVRTDLEARARAFLRAIFKPWRQSADAAAVQVISDMLAGELGGHVAQWWNTLPENVQRHLAAGLFARAKAAHDFVLESEAPLTPGRLYRIVTDVATLRLAAR